MTIKALRAQLRKELGPRHYRITRDGEVHGYGWLEDILESDDGR